MARNILVVEDDNNISNLIKMYLDKEGFEVRIAADGGKAVEEFKEKEPDLVLLDVMLPVLDGWGVCAKIRETSKCPIIMLTAKGEVNDRIHGLEMGADDYVVKPFEMKELLARINAVLRRSEIPDDTHKRLVFDKLVICLLYTSSESLASTPSTFSSPKRAKPSSVLTSSLPVSFRGAANSLSSASSANTPSRTSSTFSVIPISPPPRCTFCTQLCRRVP